MNPFARVLHVGERSTALLLALAVGASTVIHSGLALAAYVREVTVIPAERVCRAGENIQLQAFARSAWNSQLAVTNSATWQSADDRVATHAGAGFFRCVSAGTANVTVTYLNRSQTFALKVEPPLVMVDVEPEKEKEEEPPPVVLPEPEVAKAPTAPVDAKPTAEPPPPAAAKVGSLLTAPDNNPSSADEPYSFLSDPNGQEYGSGTAAVGGTADYGKPGAAATGVPNGSGSGVPAQGPATPPPPPAPTVDLSRPASLTVTDPCRGFFPGDADDDIAMVQVLVTIRPDGTVQTVSVVNENPKGQGFGKAARSCLLSTKFNPAFDKLGKPTEGRQQFNIKFTR